MNSSQIYELIKDLVNEPINTIYLWNDEEDSAYEAIINRLVVSEDPEVLLWLWNALAVKHKEYNVEESSLSEAGKALVNDFILKKKNWIDLSSATRGDNIHNNILTNINAKIEGKRLFLKPCSTEDSSELYLHHIEVDGDYAMYATPTRTTNSIKGLWINCAMPFSFFVILKETNEEIGVVSLYDLDGNYNSLLRIGGVHYYIYKEYRHKGYAYEAVSLLVDRFFNKQLKNNVTTNRQFVVEEKYCEPLCLKLRTNVKNEASNALAKKLGFVFEGTNHYHKFMDGVPQDENSYYLDLKMFTQRVS